MENTSYIKAQNSLEDTFKDCIFNMEQCDLALKKKDNIFDDVFGNLVTNGTNSTEHSDILNHPRTILPSKKSDRYSCSIERNHPYFKKSTKIQTIKRESISDEDILIRTHESCERIIVGIPNICIDKSSDVVQRKHTEYFMQNDVCLSLPSKIDKCIECRVYQMNKNLSKRDYDNISCRFYAFRQLKINKSGILSVAGYPDPFKASDNDLNMWLPGNHLSTPSNFDIQASMKILEDTGGQLCKFVQVEKKALKLHLSKKRKRSKIVWKKCVNGIREMCDVCKTTIFNYHWSCVKCGFVVCIDCFFTKLDGSQLNTIHSSLKKYGSKSWLLCSNEEEHQVDQLSFTQILAGDALNQISNQMHRLCFNNNIPLDCECFKIETAENSAFTFCDNYNNIGPIANMFNKYSYEKENSDKNNKLTHLNILINNQRYVYHYKNKFGHNKQKIKSIEDRSYNSKINQSYENKIFAPQLSLMFDNQATPHMWLCEGHLLRLLDPKSNTNYDIFQDQWKRGQPVLVSDVGKNLNSSLWHPKSFSRDFGHQKNDLINCTTSKVISDQPMSTFWNGFENASERLYDAKGNDMLLKLKDWPPSADFAETLPDRFQDLMNCLPLKEYTHRTGRYNLASRLPEGFVRPDLGPKMYTAYGNAGKEYKKISTTNLHLDMSDAINVMVYVGVTKNCKDLDYDWHMSKALEVIDEAGCDDITKKRFYVDGEIPGALWHIYHPSDADSIRDLLIKVDVEQRTPLEPFSDPIHDQTHYLDECLRERLFMEYGVRGYVIVQFFGDALFIPAGAPHQVRNLHNCIKVAEDFVSPENVHHSFRMTQEFRNLTDSHTNHEDKLQIKNIVFHAVKDSISVLNHVF